MVLSSLSPEVVKQSLDAIFVQEYQYPAGPGVATAETPEIFNQVQVTEGAYQEAILSGGGGYWVERGETEAVNQASPRVANKAVYSVSNFANSLSISKQFFEDNMHGTLSQMMRRFAMNARNTRDLNAFAVYRNAFTTQLTADGVAFVSASHTTIDGGTVSNEVSGNPALDETPLNNAIVQLIEQKSQDGVVMGMQPAALLVPPKLYKKACELVKSALVSASANNAVNVYSSEYGIRVFQSPFLGAANGGSDTAWFLLSRVHGVSRGIRKGVETFLVDYQYTTNNMYVYKGEYREMYWTSDYIGVVGSDGTGIA